MLRNMQNEKNNWECPEYEARIQQNALSEMDRLGLVLNSLISEIANTHIRNPTVVNCLTIQPKQRTKYGMNQYSVKVVDKPKHTVSQM